MTKPVFKPLSALGLAVIGKANHLHACMQRLALLLAFLFIYDASYSYIRFLQTSMILIEAKRNNL